MPLDFKQLNPGPCKSYLVSNGRTSEAILIDPLLDHVDDYLEILEKRNLKLVAVFDTHTHADHISGCASMMDRTNCDYYMHENTTTCANKLIKEDVEFEMLGVNIRAIHTPGHTRDSMTLVFPDRIFTGDVLFLDEGGAGRDDLPGGDPGAHYDSLQKILALPEKLVVYPAHDYRNRTPSPLSQQKRTNPHLFHKSKAEFESYLLELRLGPADWMKDVLEANYTCATDPGAAWIPADAPSCEVKGTLAGGANEQKVPKIGVDGIVRLLASDMPPVLVDVREPKELSEEFGHLEGVINIPVGEVASRLSELERYKDREIITICLIGGRSHTAGQILMQAGFSNVKYLDGGMMEWHHHGYPVKK